MLGIMGEVPLYPEFLVPFSTCPLHDATIVGTLGKTAEDSNSNVGKTITLITENNKCTCICAIKLTFVPSCSQMRLQLLHSHAVLKN